MLERWLRPRPPPPAPVTATIVAPAALPKPQAEASPVTCEIRTSFENNLYPSLLLSFATADPEYTRCVSVSISGAETGKSYQLEIACDLLDRPAMVTVKAPAEKFELHPVLPWNYLGLRKVIQLRPETIVATVSGKGVLTQSSVTCNLHPVNEAVSRVFDPDSNSWQDMSICFAAFVNEDHPWINSILQEAMQRDGLARFSGYEFGTESVVRQMHAIWDALAARGLSYVDIATTSGAVPDVATQYVRFLDQSLRDQGANCVDASVMMASIFRRIGLRPVLIFRPGHCFVAVYDSAQGGQLIGLETTLLSTAPFGSAFSLGAEELGNTVPHLDTPGYSSVDIAVARQAGVRPIEYDNTP